MRSQQGGVLTMLFTSGQVTSPSPVQTLSRTSEVHSSSDSVCRATCCTIQAHAAARHVAQPGQWHRLTFWPCPYYPFVPTPERPATKTPLSSLSDLLERTYYARHSSSKYLLFDFLENSAVRNILSEDFWTLDSIIFVYLCVVRSLHFVNCTFWCIREAAFKLWLSEVCFSV